MDAIEYTVNPLENEIDESTLLITKLKRRESFPPPPWPSSQVRPFPGKILEIQWSPLPILFLIMKTWMNNEVDLIMKILNLMNSGALPQLFSCGRSSGIIFLGISVLWLYIRIRPSLNKN
jgi:hypothetical protein